MKIKTTTKTYSEVLAMPRAKHKNPRKPSRLLWGLVRLIGAADLKATEFTYSTRNMEKAVANRSRQSDNAAITATGHVVNRSSQTTHATKTATGQDNLAPSLILMNHSSFLDFEIAAKLLRKHPFSIVATSDGFVGKPNIMRLLGCIPTRKFVPDVTLIHDIQYSLQHNHTSVLMYPEASYSFDGTTTPLPRHLGILLKKLGVPVIMITTYGSFGRDPLYNNLQKRKIKVSATMECLLSPEEIERKSVEELDAILDKAFDLDYFRWQVDNSVSITEPFRADGLHRILYRCPHCQNEGAMEGAGETLTCHKCGKTWKLNHQGQLEAEDGQTEFAHIPDWFRWEREQVRKAIEEGDYRLDAPVSIGVMVDYKAIYMVGDGILHHGPEGFVLDGPDGLHYEQKAKRSYSVYSDYFWYEIGDVVCIGNNDVLYYCFPKGNEPVAKVRLAGEELYKVVHG